MVSTSPLSELCGRILCTSFRSGMGNGFNQPVGGALWPNALRELSFGARFNKPITTVVWPASLEQVAFGRYFRQQPVPGVLTQRGVKLRVTYS